MKTELRYNIRERWLTAIFEFAHIEYQSKLWIKAGYEGYAGSSTEAFSQYSDDLDLNNGYDCFLKEGIVTRKEVDIVIDFHDQLMCYLNRPEKLTLSDKNILKDIEWIELTKLAKTCWDSLKKIIIEKKELEYIELLETKFLNKR